MSNATPTPLTYMPQLDALRAIAVIMVVFSHWAGYHDNMWSDTFWFNGQIGVQLFFVLSGFLITGILLNERGKSRMEGNPVRKVLAVFYVRRALRIFPLFYATLFITSLYGEPYVRQSFKWHVTYLSNVFFALRGEYMETVSHFWSLAVEEQFYLFWPLLVLFLPRKSLLPLLLITIVAAPCFRFLATFWWDMNPVAVNVLPFSNLDTLGLGGLLALYRDESNRASYPVFRRITGIAGVFCAGVFLIIGTLNLNELSPYIEFVSRASLGPVLLMVVWGCATGVTGFAGRILSHPMLVFPGRISYGIYVLHFFVAAEVTGLFYRHNWLPGTTSAVVILLLVNIMVLLCLCSLSWFLFESPIISLKKYFPYSQPLGRPTTG